MEDHDETNPIASVDALVDPAPLTISRLALLSRVNSPVLFGHAEDMDRCMEAIYLVSVPVAEAARSIKTGSTLQDSVVWADAAIKDVGTYSERICSLLDAITSFWKMIPSGEPKKKASDTGTAG